MKGSLRRWLFKAVDKAADVGRAYVAADDPLAVDQHVGVYYAVIGLTLSVGVVGDSEGVASDLFLFVFE